MKKQKDNYTYLTTGPIHRVIVTMAIPSIVSMLVMGLYNMADTFFVGRLNTASTAAVGIVFTVMFMIQASGFFFGHGSGNYISNRLGAQCREDAEYMASTACCWAFLTGVILMGVGLLLLDDLSVWLGSSPTILPYTKEYLGVVLLGTPFMMSSLTLTNQMRFQGNAAQSMYGIISGAVLNVALDPLFIFGLDMGVAGAAWATVVGQLVSFCMLLWLSGKGENIGMSSRKVQWRLELLKEIFYGGSPSLNRQGITALATLLLNVAAGRWGDEAIAAMTIVNRIVLIVFAVVIGVGQGFQPFCGFCFGAKLYERMKAGYRFTVKLNAAFLVVVCVVCVLWRSELIALFRNDPAVIRIGAEALLWQLVTWPLCAFIIGSNMLLQTCRQPIRANILASARSGLFFIPLILVLPRVMGLTGVEVCQAVSDVLTTLLAVPLVIGFFKRLKTEYETENK